MSVFLLAPAAASDKVFAEDLYRQALERFRANDFKKAHRLLQALDEKYPDHPVVLNNLGVVSGKLGKLQLAEDLFERVIALNRATAASYHNLQKIYDRRAAETYRRALVLDAEPLPAPDFRFITPAAPPAAVAEASAAERVLADERVAKPMVEEPQRADGLVAEEEEQEVLRFVTSWARAWSARDTDAYFSHYADDYRPRASVTNAKWKKSRTKRLRAPEFIAVNVSAVRVTENEDGRDVTFVQSYESNLLRSVVTKRLLLKRTADGWKIARERVAERQ